MSTSWRPLTVSSTRAQIPPLLISSTFTSKAYTIHVTDLTNIWSESLKQKDIERRSEDEATTINAGDDAEQLNQLLEKVQQALEGQADTSLSLASRKGRNRADPGGLDVFVTAILPTPLEPLKWPIHLEAMAQSTLTAQITIPLLRAQKSRLKELEELFELLKDKDHVILKLVDKLETSGANLAHVFAGAAGKNGKPLPRKQAEARVKGLKPFEEEDWKETSKDIERSVVRASVASIVEEVFDIGMGFTLDGTDASNISDLPEEDWWEGLREVSLDLSKTHAARGPHKASKLSIPKQKESENSDQDNDFQIQATPPPRDGYNGNDTSRITTLAKAIQSKIIDDSTEDEDDDLDALPSQRSAVPDSLPLLNPEPQPQPKRFGKIGGPKSKPAPKAVPKSPSPSPERPMTRSKDIPLSGDETATEDEDAPQPSSPILPPSAKRTETTIPQKRSLGKIGGKQREVTPSVPEPSQEAALPERKAEKKKLGVIGHGGKNSSAAPAAADDDDDEIKGTGAHATRGRTDVTEKEKTSPRETSLERADRKRAETRRQMEEKAKAPLKKKRRF